MSTQKCNKDISQYLVHYASDLMVENKYFCVVTCLALLRIFVAIRSKNADAFLLLTLQHNYLVWTGLTGSNGKSLVCVFLKCTETHILSMRPKTELHASFLTLAVWLPALQNVIACFFFGSAVLMEKYSFTNIALPSPPPCSGPFLTHQDLQALMMSATYYFRRRGIGAMALGTGLALRRRSIELVSFSQWILSPDRKKIILPLQCRGSPNVRVKMYFARSWALKEKFMGKQTYYHYNTTKAEVQFPMNIYKPVCIYTAL